MLLPARGATARDSVRSARSRGSGMCLAQTNPGMCLRTSVLRSAGILGSGAIEYSDEMPDKRPGLTWGAGQIRPLPNADTARSHGR